LAASSSTAPGTSHASGRLVTAREYINAIEKYMKGGVLSAAELEDALYAQHLSHQANKFQISLSKSCYKAII
jgi:hypothetical protein